MQRRDAIKYFDMANEKFALFHGDIETIIFNGKIIVIFILTKKTILRDLAFSRESKVSGSFWYYYKIHCHV